MVRPPPPSREPGLAHPMPTRPKAWPALLLLLAAGGMAALTWRSWPDPFVDFGRELYVAWRLSEGEQLYTDIAWFNGPFSPHLNAALFRLFTPGMMVLAAANAGVFCLVVAMVYDLGTTIADRGAALFGCLVLVTVFGFGQYVGIGNYNWITPYSHDLTHGVALAVASVWTLDRWRRTGRPAWSVIAGTTLGLCFLTKPEAFVAAAAGSAVLLVDPITRRHRGVALWLAGALAPLLLSLAAVGAAGTLGAWPSVVEGEVASLAFYRAGMGLDEPALRLEETLTWAAVWIVTLLIPVAGAWLARDTRTPWAGAIAFAATGGLLLLAGDALPWLDALRPLPLAAVALVGVLLLARVRAASPAQAPPTALAFAVLASALLAKMGLNAGSANYGFALAAPATVLVTIALVGWLPRALDRRGLRGAVLHGSAAAILTLFCGAHIVETRSRIAQKSEWVGDGLDTFRADIRGGWVTMAVDHLRAAGVRSVAVLPEGVLINYLARIPNPTPYINFLPPEALLFGEESWEASFRASPPEAIVFVPRDTGEYGLGPFGYGYATGLWDWVEEEYLVDTVLRRPGYAFEVKVLLRRPRTTHALGPPPGVFTTPMADR